MKPGPKNNLCDVAGLKVGNADDDALKSGVTVVLCEEPAIASVKVLGGGPGTRDTELLSPQNTVEKVDALVLSGGTAFGLDSASGVQAWLREQGRGYPVGPLNVPIVPGAILFDLINGGDKSWGRYPPYRELGYQAAENAGDRFAIGSQGAGHGATVAGMKGGLGTASIKLDNGVTIAALFAVNAVGSPVIGSEGRFWAAPFEWNGEFGGLGMPKEQDTRFDELRIKFREPVTGPANTTIGVVATDAVLTKAQAERLAIAAHDGIARAIWPAHTPMDGDLVFTLATGTSTIAPEPFDWAELGAQAAAVTSRAIARAIYEATPAPGDLFPAWRERYGQT